MRITANPRSREQESESAQLGAKLKKLENASPTCGRKNDSLSLENQKASESDLYKQATLQEFLNTLNKVRLKVMTT